MKFITISGIDKSGKTTIQNALNKATNYRHYVIDRDPSNVISLNFILGRETTVKYDGIYDFLMDRLTQIVDLAIILHCTQDDLEWRFMDSNEPELPGHLGMTEHQALIEKNFHEVGYFNKLELNTSELTVDECVDKILMAIGEYDAT